MIEPYLLEMLKAGPAQLGIVIVVLIFTKAQVKADQRKERFWAELQKAQSQQQGEQTKIFEEIHQEHIYQRELTREALSESTKMLHQTAEMLHTLAKSIERAQLSKPS